ncbi:MAG: hypothetical protein WC454_00635 [Phycisphaerae bacterium]|jgi:hypothetical protein
MKQNIKENGYKGSRILDRLAAEKKKTAIAVCLITAMAFMWVRVLVRKGPQSANAAVVAQEVVEEQTKPELKISFMELPKVDGRNDVLARDFFAVGNWLDFMRGGEGKPVDDGREAMDDEGNDNEDIVRRVTEKLRLEAIVLGENPQAFINDKLLSVGDKLVVGNGIYTYECEVSEIKENVVFIKCGETEITLRLAQTQ